MINKIVAKQKRKLRLSRMEQFILLPLMRRWLKAQEMIERLTKDIEVGDTYIGKITRVEIRGFC